MLTPNYLMNAAEPLVELWSQLECDIIADIARRIVKNGGKMTATAGWQALKARELGILRGDLTKIIARIAVLSEAATEEMILEGCEKALAFDDSLYQQAGLNPQPITQSPALMEVVQAGIRKTDGVMRNFTNTTANTAGKAFESCLDRAYMQVISGSFSYDQALRNVLRDLSRKGIERIVYPSGNTILMESAARRALITGLNQTAAELQIARMDEMGTHLVEVTSHAGARPSHAVWQGQVYWRGERVRGYANFEDSTGYGTGAGLCGWNCYHNFFPFIEGVSVRAFERDPAARLGKTNDQMYEESQRQRELERRIRESRRECAAYSAAKDAATDAQAKAAVEAMFQDAAVLLKRREAALDAFIEDTGRTKLPDRLHVPTFGRKESARAVWANRKAKK